MLRRNFFQNLVAALCVPPVTRNIRPPVLRSADGIRTELGTLTCNHPCAPWIDVIDQRSGKKLELVQQVNTVEGWAEVYKRTKNGKLELDSEGKVPTERIRGEFCLRLRKNAPYELEHAYSI